MPHFIVEYSANLEDDINFNQLFESVHETLGKSGVFPLGGYVAARFVWIITELPMVNMIMLLFISY